MTVDHAITQRVCLAVSGCQLQSALMALITRTSYNHTLLYNIPYPRTYPERYGLLDSWLDNAVLTICEHRYESLAIVGYLFHLHKGAKPPKEEEGACKSDTQEK